MTYSLLACSWALMSFGNFNTFKIDDSSDVLRDSIEEVVIQVSGLVVTGDSLIPFPTPLSTDLEILEVL